MPQSSYMASVAGRRARCTGQRARRARAGRGSPPRCAGDTVCWFREQRAADIAEHGFDVAEGGRPWGPFWVVWRWEVVGNGVHGIPMRGSLGPDRQKVPGPFVAACGAQVSATIHHNIRRFFRQNRDFHRMLWWFYRSAARSKCRRQTAATPRELPSRPCRSDERLLHAKCRRQPRGNRQRARRRTYCQSP